MLEYNEKSKTWKVNVPGWGIEEGSLQYVIGEFIGFNLIYPYNTEQTQNCEYHGHSHEFDGVLKALLHYPDSFSIEGFEEYYSKQELDLLQRLQNKLKANTVGKEM